MPFALCSLPYLAAPCGWSTRAAPAPPATATTAAKRRIRLWIDEQPVEEEIDRLRHDFDGIERAVVERVVCALNERQRGRHAERVEFGPEVDARLHRHRPVVRAVDEDRRREALRDIGRR